MSHSKNAFRLAKLSELRVLDKDLQEIFLSLPELDGSLPWRLGDPSLIQIARDLNKLVRLFSEFTIQGKSTDNNPGDGGQ
jgi:hypothetical protein